MAGKHLEPTHIQSVILPLSLVSFFLAFNFFVLKVLKETLLVTAPEAGAEAIPFVKMWLLFPISIALLGAFAWMARKYALKSAVVTMILFFLSSYAIFTFIFFPIRESLHLHSFANKLQSFLPEGWKGLASVVRYWSFSLYYVVAECWCTMIYSVVFWGYANAVMKFSEAKKYYPYLTLAGTLAALAAGPLTIFITGETFKTYIPPGFDSWEFSFYGLTCCVLACGLAALAIFYLCCPEVSPGEAGEKKGLSLIRSFAQIFSSKYLLTLAIICIAFNLTLNLTDVVWKNEILKLHSDPAEFTSYLSYVSVLTGLVSTFFTLFVCRQSFKRFGWTCTALIAPCLLLLTGAVFFLAIYLHEQALFASSLASVTVLGSLHVCISCGAKYTLFEPAKEMAFTPLAYEEKLHGKTAIDGIGARLGRTSSSLIYQLLLVVVPTISACTPIVGALIILIIAVCINSIYSLGKQMEPALSAAN